MTFPAVRLENGRAVGDDGLRRGGRGFAIRLGVIALVAFAIPAYYSFSVRAHQRFWGDPRFFYYWPATQVAHGRGFLDVLTVTYGQPVPSASHPPGFITLLAGFYKLGFQSPQAMRYLLSVLTACTVVFVGVTICRLVGERAGLIAAAIAAVFPNLWISSTLLMSETMLLFGLGLGLVGYYAFHFEGRRRSLVIASVGFTLAASARPEMLILFPAAVVPVVIAKRHDATWKRLIGLVGIAAVVPTLVFGSWFVYNLQRFDRPVLVSTGFGQTLLTGACDDVFSGPYIGYWAVKCTANSFPPEPEPGQVPDQSVLDAFYRKRAIRYYTHHKSEIPAVVAARLGRMFGVFDPVQQNKIDHYVDKRGSYRLIAASQVGFWLLLLTSIPGFVIWRRKGIPVYPLVAIFAIAVVVEAITFGNTRYRVGIDLCTVLLAATALERAWDLLGQRYSRRHVRTGDPSSMGPSGNDSASVAG